MPFLDISSLSLIKEIQENKDKIRNEFIEMINEKLYRKKLDDITYFNKDFVVENIDTISLKNDRNLMSPIEQEIYDKYLDETNKLIEIRFKVCPYMKSILDKYEDILSWTFNISRPGSRLNKHYGPNGITEGKKSERIRAQITLYPGDDCYFFIENGLGTKYLKYTSNLSFGFVDGQDLHWIENRGTQTRIVLIIDIKASEMTNNLPTLEPTGQTIDPKYQIEVKLPVNFVPHDMDHKGQKIVSYPVSYINQDFIDFLSGLGVKVLGAEYFYREKGQNGGIHIDGKVESDFCKLNFVYGGGISLMRWYKLKEGKKIKSQTTEIGTSYLYAEFDDVEQVWVSNMTGINLVNVGQLHSITNVTEPRMCYSLILGTMDGKQLHWSKAIELFKGYYE